MNLKIKNIIDYIIAEEPHKDGTPHLHMYIKTSEPYDSRDCHCLDIYNNHGKYEGCRSMKKVIKYCTKELNFITNLNA